MGALNQMGVNERLEAEVQDRVERAKAAHEELLRHEAQAREAYKRLREQDKQKPGVTWIGIFADFFHNVVQAMIHPEATIARLEKENAELEAELAAKKKKR